MTDSSPEHEAPSTSSSSEERLESWKEIAAYLNRDVSTVRRWEKREGLPVHRHLHDKLGTVYAYRSELDAWLEDRGRVEADSMQPAQGFRWKVAGLFALAVVVAGLALVVGLNVGGVKDRLLGPATPGPINSLAVLPLENLSGDPEQEYFVDGMTEALIANLAKIEALKVISRTSSMQFRGTDQSIPEIAQMLDVDVVVEGSVLRSKDRVRVTAQLIHGETDRHMWVESYERELRDVLSLQSEIAWAVAREIRVKLTLQDEARFTPARTVDTEVYEACLRARFQMDHLRLQIAEEYIREAMRRDPSYALAHALMAQIYSLLVYRSALAPSEIMPKARAAATKALELDETQAEPHAALAGILARYDWDWSGAEKEYRRALELNPGLAGARTSFSNFLSSMGRHEEAIAEAKIAVELDPLSPWSNTNLGVAFNFAHRYEEATRQHRRTVEEHPTHERAYFHLGVSYGRRGMYDEAIAALENAVRLVDGSNLRHKAWLAHFYALADRTEDALTILDDLLELEERRYIPPLSIASIYIGLNEKEQALQRLEEAYDVHDGDMYLLNVLPLPSIQSEPRFQDLLRRMNFPE